MSRDRNDFTRTSWHHPLETIKKESCFFIIWEAGKHAIRNWAEALGISYTYVLSCIRTCTCVLFVETIEYFLHFFFLFLDRIGVIVLATTLFV